MELLSSDSVELNDDEGAVELQTAIENSLTPQPL